MKIETEFKYLKLKYPFKISRFKEMKNIKTLFIYLKYKNVTGVGEIQPSIDCNETFEQSLYVISKAKSIISDDPFKLEEIINEMKINFQFAPAIIAGIDIALYDLCAKLLNIPLYKFLGLNPSRIPVSSYTIGIDSYDVMIEKLKEASDFPIIKIKAGFEGDIKTIKEIRKYTDKKIRVDVNTGWKVDEAIDKIRSLEQDNIEIIEQPIAEKNYQALKRIKSSTSIPIMADEDVETNEDLLNLYGCVDAINIKLMKCGGIRECMKLIHFAKTLGLKVMLGCMVESSVSITAAASIASLVDYVDLDTNMLLSNDPFLGAKNKNGKLSLPEESGLGISEK